MISLARHIEILLLEHDCVVIPGFGGFITKAEEAKFLEQEWQMMPPFRTVRFNQALQANDGLLVQSYMNIYDASFPAAQKQMLSSWESVLKRNVKKLGLHRSSLRIRLEQKKAIYHVSRTDIQTYRSLHS